MGALINSGFVFIQTGATLNLTNQSSVTDVPFGSFYLVGGTFTAGPNSAFVNLTSVEGRWNC